MNTRNFRNLSVIAVAGLALSAPVAAQSKEPFDALEAITPELLFKGVIREDDVSLLFKHVRESMVASMRGEEPRESPALARRTEEIQRELAVRGSVLVGVMLSALESAARQAVREAMSDMLPSIPGHSRSRPVPLPGNY